MRTTAYAYPWDVARLGAEQVVGDLVDKGIAGVDLAATYHPIDALSPRGGPMRLFSSPRGAVHFPARPRRYGSITPAFAPDESIRAAWPALDRAAASAGLTLNAWTVLIFQPWMGDRYPDCARVLPGGDAVGSGVCPASPAVQEYFALLCADLVDQFEIGTLRLEMATAPTYDYGWLRPRVLVEVPPLAAQMLAVCFCPSCVRRGTDAGIDVERVRRTLNGAIAEEVATASEPATAERARALVADAELHEFVVQHERAAVELVRATTSQLGPGPRPRVSTIVYTPYASLLGDAQADLVADLVAALDQTLVFPGGGEERTRLIADLAAAHDVELATFVVPVALATIPGQVGPSADGADRVRDELRAAAKLGVTEVNIYNYGLLRDRDVADLMTAIEEELG